jgi:hypothetical protein
MKRLSAALLALPLVAPLLACGEAERPAPVAPAPIAPSPATPEKTAPELPALWASLFEDGRESTWIASESVVTSEPGEDPSVVTTRKAERTATLGCSVQAPPAAPDRRASTIRCSRIEPPLGLDASPAGRWLTDGEALWRGDEGKETRILEWPPVATKTVGEGVQSIVAPGASPGTWCFTRTYLLGDGGVFRACFDHERGLVELFATGGSALRDVTVTLRRAP